MSLIVCVCVVVLVMVSIVDWNIDDVLDSHQRRKKRRVEAIANVLKNKGRVRYDKFLAEMEIIGIQQKVAKEYLGALEVHGEIRVDEGEIIWNEQDG